MFGQLLWLGGWGNTIPEREIPWAVPFAVINLPGHPFFLGEKQLDNCKRNSQ